MSDSLKQLSIDRSAVRTPRPRWWRYSLIFLVLLLAVTALVVLQMSKPRQVETGKVSQAWPSATLSALTATGYVAAQKKAAIASKATGRLEWLGVREGTPVKEGQLLARLESADVEAQVAQAVANVEAARATLSRLQADAVDAAQALKRSEELLAKGFLSGSANDSAISRHSQAKYAVLAQQAAIRQAQAALAVTRVGLANTEIRAPFAGVILSKNANVGDVISPFNASADSKGAVVSMADMDTLEVETDVSEASLFKASIGQPCEIQLDALPNVRLLGVVRSMVPSVDRSKATVMFKVGFVEKDARVLPDMSAKVNFLTRALAVGERTPRLAVPAQAVVDGAVFVVKEGVAQRRLIKAGGKLGDLIEVQAGLQVGDVVVLNPVDLKDGSKVAEKKA